VRLEIESADAEIWRLSLDLGDYSSELIDAMLDLLSIEERARADNYRFERDRIRFAVCRASLRCILGLYTSIPPKQIPLEYGVHGKPLINVPSAPIRFNLSHCTDHAVIAASGSAEIGVDIEDLTQRRCILEIARNLMSPRELSFLRNIPEDAKTKALLKCLTSKEAYLKGRGIGLFAPLSAIDVVIDPCEPPRLLEDPDLDRETWFLYELNLGERYYGILAGSTQLSKIRGHQVQFRRDCGNLDELFRNPTRMSELLSIQKWQPIARKAT
jgi:4'-phosphopantetheinyl transferase